jgi:DNA-binding LytR/AlgR family response regulator
MNPDFAATALIAEDEPLLAEHLAAELARLWPALRLVARVGDGPAAVERALALAPQVLFLDIRMPGHGGIEVVEVLADAWPAAGAAPFPQIVFVTAYDQYALQAFEHAAVDYLLKPLDSDRLGRACGRVQRRLAEAVAPSALDAAIEHLRRLAAFAGHAGQAATPRLRTLQAAAGTTIHLVPVEQVIYFEAADKYLRVVTAEREHLIRTSLRDLLPQLDAERFWQVHRGTVVRCDAIASAERDDAGRITLRLAGHRDRLAVSRLYAWRFKAM